MTQEDDRYQEALKEFKTSSSAFYNPAIVHTAIELGVFDAIAAGAQEPEAIARAVKADARSMKALLATLSTYGYLSREEWKFSLTPFSAKALVRGSPAYEGDSALMSLWFLRLSSRLAQVVRTGEPEETYEDVVKANPEFAGVLVRAMDQISRPFLPGLVKAVSMEGVRDVLDVGGASGSYTMALLENNPSARGTVFELPHAALEAERLIASRGYQDRVRVVRGDLRKDELGAGEYDLIFFSNLFHQLDRETSADTIARTARALRPGGRLIIKEMVGNERGEVAGVSSYQILMLLISKGGALHDEPSYAGWCKEAGLGPIERINCWERSSLLISRKAR